MSWLQTVPFFLTFLCALLLLFSKWYVRARWGVSLPLEHLLKMENKMHCDILAKRPFSGFGKSQLNRHSLSHNGRKPHSPNVTSEPVCCYIFSIHLIILPFIFKDKGSKPLHLCLSFHKSLPPSSYKSYPHESKTCIAFSCFRLARVNLQMHLYLNGVDSLKLLLFFFFPQKLTKIAKEIKSHFGHFKSFSLNPNF